MAENKNTDESKQTSNESNKFVKKQTISKNETSYSQIN